MRVFAYMLLLLLAPLSIAQGKGACALLPVSSVEQVQGGKLVAAKAQFHDDGKLTAASCYFQLDPDTQSISLEILSRNKGDALDPAAFWKSKFESKSEEEESDREMEHRRGPEHIEGLGQDSFWVDTGRDGALYILMDDKIIRLSLGGGGPREEKKTRSVELAKLLHFAN